MTLLLSEFSMRRPTFQTDQRRALDWLAEAHTMAESTVASLGAEDLAEFRGKIQRAIDRCACGPTKIGSRGHVVPDPEMTRWEDMSIYDVTRHPHGKDAAARVRVYAEIVDAYFEQEYADASAAPSDIVHVTCTGYVSPSGAQKLVAGKGWGDLTRVTHAYHMGCYAAFPAVRLAAGCLHTPACLSGSCERRVDIVHTELCSLHLDPSNHGVDQLVVQSLFADGFIRYSMRPTGPGPGLSVLSLDERILPDSSDAMSWTISGAGMKMTLARDVPQRIAAALRGFVVELYGKAGLDLGQQIGRSVFAVHPGGPRIIDGVADVLELAQEQVQISRDVLFDYGNMSSATLPHVWMRIVDDPAIPTGTPIVSLAFGPGLTVCGGVFRKE